MVLWIYTTVVLPILLYGSLVWWESVKKKYIVKRLNSFQRSAGMAITGAFKTTPADALEVLLNILPLDLQIRRAAVNTAIRLYYAGWLKVRSTGHSSILNNMNIDLTKSVDYMNKVDTNETEFSIEIPDRDCWSTNGVLTDKELAVFTDGSKTESGVGAGVFIESLGYEESFRLPQHCTVYQAELLGIKKAADRLLIGVSGKDIAIYIDNKAAITSLASHNIKSKLVSDCREVLQALCRQNIVKLCWVPGHNDITGNEMADLLAKRKSLATIKDAINKEMFDIFSHRWITNPGCNVSRQLWPNVNRQKSNWILSLKRVDLRNIIGALTGHCLTGKHAKTLKIKTSDECRHCNEHVEDMEHLFCECPNLARRRFYILGSYFFEDLEDMSQLALSKVLKFVNVLDIL